MAFGIPEIHPFNGGTAYIQVREMPGFPTLKEALIAALVAGKDFEDYFDGDGDAVYAGELEHWTSRLGIARGAA